MESHGCRTVDSNHLPPPECSRHTNPTIGSKHMLRYGSIKSTTSRHVAHPRVAAAATAVGFHCESLLRVPTVLRRHRAAKARPYTDCGAVLLPPFSPAAAHERCGGNIRKHNCSPRRKDLFLPSTIQNSLLLSGFSPNKKTQRATAQHRTTLRLN